MIREKPVGLTEPDYGFPVSPRNPLASWTPHFLVPPKLVVGHEAICQYSTQTYKLLL